ncbi:MAG: pantoate--beta-alanine ligase [Gemmatimonadales bacterium]|jgi:pantoate--beta-alanine ligase
MQTVITVDAWRGIRRDPANAGSTIGFVPTMGALHAGHFSLVERSVAENDRTVVSVFVNPTQFNDPADLERYPRDLDADRAALARLGVDYLFLPRYETLYPDDYRYRVVERERSTILCGARRPGHFEGVLTVVLRLLAIVCPHRAYFGEKDYQQYELVRDMARSFFLDVEIVPCPIVRDADGVALSSRNALLSPEGRVLAASFARALREAPSVDAVRRTLAGRGIEIDYVEEHGDRRYGAVVINGVRLIDNVPRPTTESK